MSEHKQDERIGSNTGAALLAGKYEIIEDISRGGFGRVVKVRHVEIDRIFAAKVIIPDVASPESIKRLVREGQILNKLKHPNLVEVFASAMDEQQGLVLVMQYLDGEPLSKLRPLPVPYAVDIAGQICEGLQYAHDNGITHRDLKPSNVMIVDEDGKKRAIIIDFGIAKADANQKLTATGAILGTPLYMAPEQFTGSPASIASDIYSFGCVFYEILTGMPPFEADNPVAVAAMHQAEPVVPPSEVAPDVPGSLDNIVLKCLAKNPAERYQSMREIAQALQKADLQQRAIRGKAKRRLAPMRPSAISAALVRMVIAFVCVGFVAGSMWWWQQRQREEEPRQLNVIRQQIDHEQSKLLAPHPSYSEAIGNFSSLESSLDRTEKNYKNNKAFLQLLFRLKSLRTTCNLLEAATSKPVGEDARRARLMLQDAASGSVTPAQRIYANAAGPRIHWAEQYLDFRMIEGQALVLRNESDKAVEELSGVGVYVEAVRNRREMSSLYRMRYDLLQAEIARARLADLAEKPRLSTKDIRDRTLYREDLQVSIQAVKAALARNDFIKETLDEQVDVKLWVDYANMRLKALQLG
jgi:serine/threonine protein kinase